MSEKYYSRVEYVEKAFLCFPFPNKYATDRFYQTCTAYGSPKHISFKNAYVSGELVTFLHMVRFKYLFGAS